MAKKFFDKPLRPRLESSSSLFARKGDPWITERERERSFGAREGAEQDADNQRFQVLKDNAKAETPKYSALDKAIRQAFNDLQNDSESQHPVKKEVRISKPKLPESYFKARKEASWLLRANLRARKAAMGQKAREKLNRLKKDDDDGR